MTARTLIASFLFAITGAAHADTIIGGPRQAYDAAHCSVYRGTWAEYDWVLPIGTVVFGPEMPIPGWLSSSGAVPPEQDAAVSRLFLYGRLHSRYVAPDPVIGYDQLIAIFAYIWSHTGVGSVGPLTAMPMPTRYPGLRTDPEVMRAYKIAVMRWNLSYDEVLTVPQLDVIENIALQTPTCGGVAY